MVKKSITITTNMVLYLEDEAAEGLQPKSFCEAGKSKWDGKL